MEYKIFNVDNMWKVYSGYISIEFVSDSIADCYAWIKAKQEGLLG